MTQSADSINNIISNAIKIANSKAEQANQYAQQALTASTVIVNATPQLVEQSVNVGEPRVEIPFHVAGADNTLYETLKTQLVELATSKLADFFSTYFPNTCAWDNAMEWVCQTIANGGSGIPPGIENQIWERDRARILADADRAQEESTDTWAAKGYPLPPGAAVHSRLTIARAAQDKIAQSSRDAAIKHIDIIVENLRFAVQQGIQLRIASLNAAAQYIEAIMRGPALAAQMATSQVNAQAGLISAASSFYNARINVAQLEAHVREFNASQVNQFSLAVVNSAPGLAQARAQAALGAATAAGNQAAAALSSINAIGNIASIENV